MRIVDIRERTVPLRADMRNAAIGFDEMTASAVALVTDVVRAGRAVVGYGFSSIGRYGHGGLLRERFIPRLRAADIADEACANLDPFKAWDVMMRNEKSGGHGERSGAVGVLDMALWDATAKIEGVPLWRLLADRFCGGAAVQRVPVYASGGHYHETGGLGALTDEIRGYRDAGYTRVKIKVAAAPLYEDAKRIEAALSVVGTGDALAVDANAVHDRDGAIACAEAFAPFRLAWIEEIGDPLDFELQRELCARYDGPMATGENLFSLADAQNLIRYAGLRPDRDLLQFDIPLSYGLVEYLRILEMLEAHGWSRRQCIPHAGHLLALNAAAGLGLGGHEVAPGRGLPYGGFPDGVEVEDGHVRVPELPGIGFEGKSNFWEVLKALVD